MELLDKDLNLLVLFATIWQERKLSKVAERMFLSQPAISHALNRLRQQFDDPLFVKSSVGMAPTDFAQSIAPEILQLVASLELLYRSGKGFDPKECDRTLVLSTGDYFAATMLKDFTARLNKMAPKVNIVCYPDSELFSPTKFEQGEIHLGISGFVTDIKEGFRSKDIIHDRIACCLRKKHALNQKKLPLPQYLAADHVLVSVVGRTFGIVDQKLKTMKKNRNVKMVVPSFFEAGALLAKTELILTAPRGLCLQIAKSHGLAAIETPFPKMPFTVRMHWHQRTDADPFHIWVRQLMEDVAGGVLQ